ncbi:hypothetical protein ACP70R_042631 [Stipagrostis hirtigluma subsp. patula]
MEAPLEEYGRSLSRRPDCFITVCMQPVDAGVQPPRHLAPSFYFLFVAHNLYKHGVYDCAVDVMEEFEVPDFPVSAVCNLAFRGFFQRPHVEKEQRDMLDAEATADGLLINAFGDIEGAFVDVYAAALASSRISLRRRRGREAAGKIALRLDRRYTWRASEII